MPSPARPNVLVILTDQQRHDTTGAHGCPLNLTPNYDQLARRGTHAANCFTCQPVCAPARSCLQTGLYATQTGIWRNGYRLKPGQRTLAHSFNEAGYRTGYMGKWHLMPDTIHGAVPEDGRGGYQRWLAANILEFVSDAYDCRLWDENGVEHQLPGYRVDALTDAAIRFMAEPATEPFFLFVSFLEPHHQNSRDDYPAPAGWDANSTHGWLPPDLRTVGGTAAQHWPGYCGMIRRIDDGLGRMLDALRSRGQLDNTVILYTSDHGNHFKTRNAEYKRSCHEASIRVPAVLAGPGFEGGGQIAQLVSLVDLPPTLLDAAGLAIPPEMEGQSLLKIRRQDAADWPTEVFVQISESQTGRAVRTHRWKYSVRAPELGTDGKPVSLPSSPVYADDCLYDLYADPWEQANLVGFSTHRHVVTELRQRLVRRMTAIGESEPRFLDAPDRFAFERVVKPGEASL